METILSISPLTTAGATALSGLGGPGTASLSAMAAVTTHVSGQVTGQGQAPMAMAPSAVTTTGTVGSMSTAMSAKVLPGVCEHGRVKSTCKECKGTAICPHARIKSSCKECGGGSICSHGKRKSQCKDCGGGSICTHGRIKRTCKECKGQRHLPAQPHQEHV